MPTVITYLPNAFLVSLDVPHRGQQASGSLELVVLLTAMPLVLSPEPSRRLAAR